MSIKNTHYLIIILSISIFLSCRKDKFREYKSDVMGEYCVIKTRNDWIEETNYFEQDTFDLTVSGVADSFIVISGELFTSLPNTYKVHPNGLLIGQKIMIGHIN